MSSKKILLACTALVLSHQTNGSDAPDIVITPVSSAEDMSPISSPNSVEMISPTETDPGYLTLTPPNEKQQRRYSEEIFLKWRKEMEKIQEKIAELTKTLLKSLEFAYLSCEKIEEKSRFAAARAKKARYCFEKTLENNKSKQEISDYTKCLKNIKEATKACKNVLDWFERPKPLELLYNELLCCPAYDDSREFDFFDENQETENDKIISFLQIRGITKKNLKQQIIKKKEEITMVQNQIKTLEEKLAKLKEDKSALLRKLDSEKSNLKMRDQELKTMHNYDM